MSELRFHRVAVEFWSAYVAAKRGTDGDLGRLRLGDMPGRFSDAVVALSVGQPSAPVRSEEAVHVFMVCAREDPEPDLPTRDDVANSLWDQRLDLLARRYLRDLRRAAVIEYR